MARKKIRVGNVVLCEYATKGERNKHVLVNTYSGNVVFDALPADFSFGLYLEMLADQDFSQVVITMRLDREEFLRVTTNTRPNQQGVIVLPMVHGRIDSPANFDVVLSAEGFADTVVMTKRLYAASAPNASEPPSALSRPASRKKAKRP